MMTHTVNSSVEDTLHPQPQPQPSSAALFSLPPLALDVVVSSPTQVQDKLKTSSSSDAAAVSKCIVSNSRELGFEEKKDTADVVISCGIQEDVDVLARKISNLGSLVEKCKKIELGSASGEVINQVKIEEQGKCKVKLEMDVRHGHGHGRETNSFLESKKKNLSTARSIFEYGNAEKFTDCESSFVHNDSCIGINKLIKMEIIDDTALIDSVTFPPTRDTWNGRQQGEANKPRLSGKKARDVKNVSQLMISERQSKMVNYTASVVPRNDGNGIKRLYSREEMGVLRLANIVEQRQMWRDIYTGLPPAVVKEYKELAIPKRQNNIGLNFDPRSRYRYVRKTEPSVIPSVIAAN